ncbi:hypothetical protein J2T20_002643 [Paenibacillus wynnii]|nr:hypothetical protein [Paenibacillus wynnii]
MIIISSPNAGILRAWNIPIGIFCSWKKALIAA